MRCKNCGWENPEHNTRCERCSSPLDVPETVNAETAGPEAPAHASEPLRATIREASGFNDRQSEKIPHPETPDTSNESRPGAIPAGNCSNCGYHLSPGMNICPMCGTPQNRKAEAPDQELSPGQNNHRGIDKQCPKCGGPIPPGARFCASCGQPLRNSGTVNAWDNPQNYGFCSLRPIPWSRENASYNAITYSGDRIILNRANTDPNNQSITSHEQAVLTREGNDWYIEDMSEQHSTMIRISRKTRLQSGDIIALGNRLFEFTD